MSKWSLQQQINNCECRISDNEQEISKLRKKIEMFNEQIGKMSTVQSEVESYYNAKRVKCEALQSTTKGRAATSAIDKSVTEYSITNCNVHLDKLENIKVYIQANISKANEIIGDLNTEISSLRSTISWCRGEIRRIEREEEEAKNAELNCG